MFEIPDEPDATAEQRDLYRWLADTAPAEWYARTRLALSIVNARCGHEPDLQAVLRQALEGEPPIQPGVDWPESGSTAA